MIVLRVLWLPILLSSVFVFVASALIHMVLQWWHRSDYGKMPQEDKVMEALRPFAIPPGDYMVPSASHSAEFRAPEFKEKLSKGPVMMVTVMPSGMMNMGKSLGLWFLYLLVVSYMAASSAANAVPHWSGHRNVFHVVGMTSFLGYAAALWQMTIWYRRSALTSIKATVDGLLYAVITALTFCWLWPT